MADQLNLQATTGRRAGSRESRRIRNSGAVPGVVYGKDTEPIPFTVDHRELLGVLATDAGSNAVINLDIDGKSLLTMPKVVEKHPYRNEIRHIDFVTISLTEKVHAEVPIHLMGEAPGTLEGGLLSQPRNSVEVAALPTSIPSYIELDISELGVGDTLRVSDLPEIADVEYLDDPEFTLVSVTVPMADEPEPEEESALAEGEEAEEGADDEAGEGSAEAAEDGDEG